jgi:hypothetical protein
VRGCRNQWASPRAIFSTTGEICHLPLSGCRCRVCEDRMIVDRRILDVDYGIYVVGVQNTSLHFCDVLIEQEMGTSQGTMKGTCTCGRSPYTKPRSTFGHYTQPNLIPTCSPAPVALVVVAATLTLSPPNGIMHFSLSCGVCCG